MCTALVGVYYPEQPYQVNQMSRTPSPSNHYDALLVDDEEGSDDRRSPPQPRPRPLRTLTPNTRTAYAARASARRVMRDSIPEEQLATSFTGSRPSFADVLAGVAATAAPQPQISTDASGPGITDAPSLGDLAAQQGAATGP